MAKEIVIFPGGFHPIHPGHVSVYNALKKAFPAADVYIASSDSTQERPFPFDDKKVLATAAGIPTDKFIEVVSPYKSIEITKNYDPSKDYLIFGLSAKDASRLAYTKKDGTPGYFQKYRPGIVMDVFEKHAYVYIAPTVTFTLMGQTVSSASIIRKMYGEADDAGKHEILKELYPKGDPNKIKTIFDRALTTSESYMPARYKAGLSSSTAKKRRVFWTKLGKYPYSKSEYTKAKHAPGDSMKTTPSKYTTAYKNKFGEDLNENAALDKTLTTKSKASGIPRGILRKVYNRGMAAWVTGHRPGASQQAWGMGRVNSFIVKGKTWHTTDSDLAKKVRSEHVDEHIVHSKNGWTLFSKKTHKRLGGPYPSKEQAIKREKQVTYFKHMSENKIKTFTQLSEELKDLQVDPKGDQEVLLELEIPSEVKKNIDDGFDLLKQNNNKGANSSIIQFAKKLQSGEQADKDMLVLWQAKFKIHQTSKDHGWGKKSHKELQQLLAKETPDGYIPWMLLGGDIGKKFVDDSLQEVIDK